MKIRLVNGDFWTEDDKAVLTYADVEASCATKS